MPADRRARSILVDQRHRKRVGVDTSPLCDRGAQRQQERWQCRRRHPIVRLTKERDTPPCDDTAHCEVGERDTGNRNEEVPLLRCRDEVVAIVEAWRQIGLKRRGGLAMNRLALHLSPERVVVPRRVFFGPAFRVTLLFCPAERCAACFGPVRRPTPPLTSLRPGFSPSASARLFFGRVPVTFGPIP